MWLIYFGTGLYSVIILSTLVISIKSFVKPKEVDTQTKAIEFIFNITLMLALTARVSWLILPYFFTQISTTGVDFSLSRLSFAFFFYGIYRGNISLGGIGTQELL